MKIALQEHDQKFSGPDKVIKLDRAVKPDKALKFEKGRIYYTKAFERKLLFNITLIMLVLGLLLKLGIL